MSDSPLTEEYLGWLGLQVRDDIGMPRGRSYSELFRVMHSVEFTWRIPMDNNRIGDGLALRTEFGYLSGNRPNAVAGIGPCSFLEVLVGLSRRLAFDAGGEAPRWAWQLVENLNLHHLGDPLAHRHKRRVEDVLAMVIWRTYRPDGLGGFFPLAYPQEDQREVEIWYQMAAYISELHPEQ